MEHGLSLPRTRPAGARKITRLGTGGQRDSNYNEPMDTQSDTGGVAAGASERSIMNQTRHHSLIMVRRYIRDGSLFRENAAAIVGL